MAVCATPVDHCSCVDPSSVTDRFWVYCRHPQRALLGETYGKWLVFKPVASGELDEVWHKIRRCVETAEFGDGCTAAKCSTALDNPEEAPPGSQNGVVCVYTTREAVDEVGLQLIHKVCQTIRYKTDETTMKGLYAHKGHGKVTIRTLYWNDGKPSFGPRTLPADVNPTSITDDTWVYCKPTLLVPQRQGNAVYGKWLVFEKMESLDEMWHMIRRAVEGGEFGRGCTGARCSTAFKPDGVSHSDGVIAVTTTKEGMDEVGMLLINKVCRDIPYKTPRPPPDRMGRHTYKSKKPSKKWLYWNDGEPSFEPT